MRRYGSTGISWKLPERTDNNGADEVKSLHNVEVFHAGTALQDNTVVTNGGRVLGVTALGDTIAEAIDNAYDAVSRIHWDGAYYRKDIGKKALNRNR